MEAMVQPFVGGIAVASVSESAAEKGGLRWAVSPTEDMVQALLETLVDPLLPLRVSNVPPSEDVQIAVAKQMHAVVLLYNYHHRKQKQDLVFLEFVDFCKLAIAIRPPLIVFMKMMKESKPQVLYGTEDRLSITERAIKGACDIALGLDASRDFPNMEGWPISNLTVLLIDSKENCMLQSGAVTEGALSLIQKELNVCIIPPELSTGNKIGNKRKRDNLLTYNTEFLQLGYDVVKDVTGISSSELEVLETHVTYSLSKEKSAAWFYIMQCPGSFDEHKQVPLKFLVERLQGPLAEKSANGSWKTTPLIKLYHMLPYMRIIWCWLSRLEMEVNSSDKKGRQNCYGNNKFIESSPGRVASPDDIFQDTEKYVNLTSKFVKRFKILDSAESNQNGVLENLADGSEQPDKGLSSSPSRGLYEMPVKGYNAMEEFEKGCDIADPTTEVASINILEKADAVSDDPVTDHSTQLYGKTAVDDSLREKFKEKHVGDSDKKDERRICPENLDEERVKCCKVIFASPPRLLKTTDGNDLSDTCTDSEDNKMRNSKLKVYCHKRKKKTVQLQEAVPDLKEDMSGSLQSNLTKKRDEKVCGVEGYLTKTCNQTGSTSSGDKRAQLEAKTKPNVEVQGTLDSFRSNQPQRRYEKVSGDEGYLTTMDNQTGAASTENQRAQLQAEMKHTREVHTTLESLRSDHIQSRDELVSGKMGDLTQECNHTSIAAKENQLVLFQDNCTHDLGAHTTSGDLQLVLFQDNCTRDLGAHITSGDQRAQIETKTRHNVEVQGSLDSFRSNQRQRRYEKVSGDEGYLTTKDNQIGAASTENQRAQLQAEMKHNREVQTTLESLRSDHTQSRDEIVSGKMGDLTRECNHTSIAAKENQLVLFQDNCAHDSGAHTTSASDEVQNALALIYKKRQELYSQLCNTVDELALCEDNYARICDGGDVDLARQCIDSVISGKFSLMENRTQVHRNGNRPDEKRISQHGNPTRLSEVYLPGNSSCQDLEYTCQKNNWRLPRYLIQSSDGGFLSTVVVNGKDFEFHAKGVVEPNPRKARETAAANMIAEMHNADL
ncbi:hypothetical protein AAHA92_22965 [Salvia divinorum]|uniref:DRBM domain-containing protein n=1 Tax=Salvia divinorum TaxID=28513 RepID=A0ABD1GQF1_SALDI